MSSYFENKTIWLIGASDGIGAALTKQLLGSNATIVLSARNESKLNALAALSKKATIHVLPLDLSQPNSYKLACKLVLEKYQNIDLLILCAGMAHKSKVIDTDEKVDDQVMQVNYTSLVQITKAILPSMLLKKRGHIVVISSILGEIGLPLVATYAASKHALNGYFNSLRYEVESANITVSIISPGFINTDITKKSLKGDGSTYNENSEAQTKGMNADKCAKEIKNKIAKQRQMAYVGGIETNMPKIARLMPSIFQFLMKKLHKI